MKRENAVTKSTAPPRLPPEAEQEILEALFEGMEIHSDEIAAILKKHGVSGDMEALQDSYRKRLGQRLMASLRDENGRREVLAIPGAPDLTLSGHTHAMQLQWGNHSPAALAYREWGGLYREQEASLYVSTGVGGSVPFRLGAWPQLTLITLKRGNTP